MKSMKNLYLSLILFIVASSQGQNDTLFVWKAGNLVIKQSIKAVDVDSITFKRPTVNLSQVTIGTQVWKTKNLDVATYNDGTPIPQVTDPAAWTNLTTGAWCYYNNDATNGPVYGKLYNWYAVAGIYDAASLANPALRKNPAPIGWHVSTDTEWTTLITFLGGAAIAGGPMKESGTAHWITPNTGATNTSGFTALPGGFRRGTTGAFGAIGYGGFWWGSSENTPTTAWYRDLFNSDTNTNRYSSGKKSVYSVRCVKD